MKAKGCTQEELANQLGVARTNVIGYLSLNGLKPDVIENVKRLTLRLGHLLQIVRLPNPKDQMQLAQECHDKDLSVRQRKALVDRARAV